MVYIDGRWVKKPTKGRCAYCGSDLLEFYDDGTGICLNCGRTFSWLKPLSGPVTPQASTAPQAPPQHTAPPQRSAKTAQTYRGRPPASTPRRAPEPMPRGTAPPASVSGEFPEGPGFLSPKAVSIIAFLGALFIGIGAITYILAIPMGSWPKQSDVELIGNITKSGMIIWALGTMLFLMAGFAAAGTREMSYRVRAALITSSVALAILSFALWIGLRMMNFGMGHP